MIRINVTKIVSILLILIGIILIGLSIKIKEDNKKKYEENKLCKYTLLDIDKDDMIYDTNIDKAENEDELKDTTDLIYKVFKSMNKDTSKENVIKYNSKYIEIVFTKYESNDDLEDFSKNYNKSEYGTNKKIKDEENLKVYTVNYLNDDNYYEEIIAIASISTNEKRVLVYKFIDRCLIDDLKTSIIDSIKVTSDDPNRTIENVKKIELSKDDLKISIDVDDKYNKNDEYNNTDDNVYLKRDDSLELNLYLYMCEKCSNPKDELIKDIKSMYEISDVETEEEVVNGNKYIRFTISTDDNMFYYHIKTINSKSILVIKTKPDNENGIIDVKRIKLQ